jgi:predicted DNA-binding transcriptional regulator YafY
MPKFKPQYRRLLFIDSKLRENSYPNSVSLAREWEVSGRTISRDIDYLRDELRAPIEYDRAHNGFYYTEENYSLPTVPVSESDLFAVCIAAKALKQFENTPLHARLSSIFDKLQQSLPGKVDADPSWLEERILIFPESATTIKPEVWETIAAAVRQSKQVRITYRTPGAPRTVTRVIEPYYLVSYRGEWYANGHCHRRESIRTFALSRIHTAETLPQTFIMPPEYDAETMFGDRFGIYWQEEKETVRIQFNATVAHFIRERQWHPLQRIEKQPDGSIILEFSTNHISEVKSWVLSWGAAARILSPAPLAKDIAKELKQAAASYVK